MRLVSCTKLLSCTIISLPRCSQEIAHQLYKRNKDISAITPQEWQHNAVCVKNVGHIIDYKDFTDTLRFGFIKTRRQIEPPAALLRRLTTHLTCKLQTLQRSLWRLAGFSPARGLDWSSSGYVTLWKHWRHFMALDAGNRTRKVLMTIRPQGQERSVRQSSSQLLAEK